jgi:uncharacterized surface protein with fasciclin (FAS1) repeats
VYKVKREARREEKSHHSQLHIFKHHNTTIALSLTAITNTIIIISTKTFKMKFLNLAALASTVVAQSDLASILSSQSDLSTLAELLALVPDIAETLASASNITIFAPTNEAFASVPLDIPEGEAISQRNDTIAIGALLSNHVFKGYYPAKVATDIPVFVQSLLDSSFVNYRQPFGNFTGGQYNGIVKDGDDVVVISGEETLSYVTEAVSTTPSQALDWF